MPLTPSDIPCKLFFSMPKTQLYSASPNTHQQQMTNGWRTESTQHWVSSSADYDNNLLQGQLLLVAVAECLYVNTARLCPSENLHIFTTTHLKYFMTPTVQSVAASFSDLCYFVRIKWPNRTSPKQLLWSFLEINKWWRWSRVCVLADRMKLIVHIIWKCFLWT